MTTRRVDLDKQKTPELPQWLFRGSLRSCITGSGQRS